jgi:SAM-dependent methyltransferase
VDVGVLELPLPVADDTFDLALVDDRSPRPPGFEILALLPALRAALRPGGHLVVLLPAGGGWLSRLFGGTEPPPAAPALLDALAREGFRAWRLVTVRDGVGFVEGSTPSA